MALLWPSAKSSINNMNMAFLNNMSITIALILLSALVVILGTVEPSTSWLAAVLAYSGLMWNSYHPDHELPWIMIVAFTLLQALLHFLMKCKLAGVRGDYDTNLIGAPPAWIIVVAGFAMPFTYHIWTYHWPWMLDICVAALIMLQAVRMLFFGAV